MAERQPVERENDQGPLATSRPRSSPQTDPTNPCRQEETGQWRSAEETAERHAEPGLTEEQRARRGVSG